MTGAQRFLLAVLLLLLAAPGARADELESFLARKFHALLETLTRHDVPTTLLRFPRLATDSDYLYRKLRPALGRVWRRRFRRAFRAVSRPELIHEFGGMRQPVAAEEHAGQTDGLFRRAG